MPAAESEIDAPPTNRLVIRVKLISQEPPPPPPRWRLSKGALLLILGAVAVLLGWLAISMFRSDPTVLPAATEAPALEPTPKATEPEVKSVAPAVQQLPDAPPSAIDEVIPAVLQSALATITGTIKISVRVTIDKQGTVVDAAAVERGPSRYFERLAKEASKKWTFTPATSDERRTMLVRFNFTRGGVTAQAGPPQ